MLIEFSTSIAAKADEKKLSRVPKMSAIFGGNKNETDKVIGKNQKSPCCPIYKIGSVEDTNRKIKVRKMRNKGARFFVMSEKEINSIRKTENPVFAKTIECSPFRALT